MLFDRIFALTMIQRLLGWVLMYFEIFFEYILESMRGEEKIVPICKIY